MKARVKVSPVTAHPLLSVANKLLVPLLSNQTTPTECSLFLSATDLDVDQRYADASLLSKEEKERANQFRYRLHRDRYIRGRTFLRETLARHLSLSPRAIQLKYGESGKPRLSDDYGSKLFFNASHCENRYVLAISNHGEVGIDIENGRELPDESELVERFFSESEKAEYHRLPAELKRAGFYNGWTRKEAILKAKGTGLTLPLDSFSVALDPRQPCRILHFKDPSESMSRWHLAEVENDLGSTISVAIRGDSPIPSPYAFNL